MKWPIAVIMIAVAAVLGIGVGPPVAAAVTLANCFNFNTGPIIAADTGLQPGGTDRAITADATNDDKSPAPMTAATGPPDSIASRPEYGMYFTTAQIGSANMNSYTGNQDTMVGARRLTSYHFKETFAGNAVGKHPIGASHI